MKYGNLKYVLHTLIIINRLFMLTCGVSVQLLPNLLVNAHICNTKHFAIHVLYFAFRKTLKRTLKEEREGASLCLPLATQ